MNGFFHLLFQIIDCLLFFLCYFLFFCLYLFLLFFNPSVFIYITDLGLLYSFFTLDIHDIRRWLPPIYNYILPSILLILHSFFRKNKFFYFYFLTFIPYNILLFEFFLNLHIFIHFMYIVYTFLPFYFHLFLISVFFLYCLFFYQLCIYNTILVFFNTLLF